MLIINTPDHGLLINDERPFSCTPNNLMGVSNPKEGSNYVGIVTHIMASKDGREYITAPLDGFLEKFDTSAEELNLPNLNHVFLLS